MRIYNKKYNVTEFVEWLLFMRKYLLIAIIILLISSASIMAKDDGKGKDKVQIQEKVKIKGPAEVIASDSAGTMNIPRSAVPLVAGDNGGPGPSNTVRIKGLAFQPSTMTVPAGTVVIWHNEDGTDHTVTSDVQGLFDSGVLGAGKKFSFSFGTPGSYSYHCNIHTNMHGVIVVTGATTSSSARSIIPPSGQAASGTSSSGAGSSASWSEKPLGQSQRQSISQGIIQSDSGSVSGSQSVSQNSVLQYSQYYKMAPQAPSQPLTAPVQYQLPGQEPSMLYFGSSQKAVQFSQYQTSASYAGMNSLWIQGASSWTQYAQIPQGASLSMIAVAPTNGNGYMYEANPDGTLIKNGYLFYPYNQMGFYADTIGQHLLFFMVNGQPSNVVVVDVIAYQPPPPVISYASITISSSWFRGYSVYLDGKYQASEGAPGQPTGSVNIIAPGDQYHTVAVSGPGFSFSDYRLFRADWSYTLNI